MKQSISEKNITLNIGGEYGDYIPVRITKILYYETKPKKYSFYEKGEDFPRPGQCDPDRGYCSIRILLPQLKIPWVVEVSSMPPIVKFGKEGIFQTGELSGQGLGSYLLNELVKFVVDYFPSTNYDREINIHIREMGGLRLDTCDNQDKAPEESEQRLANWYAEWGISRNAKASGLRVNPLRIEGKVLLIPNEATYDFVRESKKNIERREKTIKGISEKIHRRIYGIPAILALLLAPVIIIPFIQWAGLINAPVSAFAILGFCFFNVFSVYKYLNMP